MDFWKTKNLSKFLREQLDEEYIVQNGENTITILLLIALEERERGVWQRFPEDIFIGTMSAFSRFVEFYKEATGSEGYGKSTWPLRHVNARLFRIGELEYELEELDGKRTVGMHIPAGARFIPDAINNSLQKEKAFMDEYFPEWADLPHTCESWMLSPVLDDMLSDNSRIRWFRSLFDITEYDPEVNLYLEFLFGLEYFQWHDGIDLNTLREDTSLWRTMKRFVLSGGTPGVALGVLKSRENSISKMEA